ncbi:MAG TPA: polysaccharide deacetylase family protein [Burkholderiaceae bacterium]|nr:polysaccharide deacetylase family protein [Burkholderiaceae bacterium]
MEGDARASNSAHHAAGERVRLRIRLGDESPPTWRPAPVLKLSLAWHGAAGAMVALAPPLWPWAVGAVAANHLFLAAAGLVPSWRLLGPNIVRLPPAAMARRQVALTFDDGPDAEATPRVLDLLDTAGARGTFFCIGRLARRHPALVREIVARGHRVENHGDSHSKATALYGYRRLRADIIAAQETLADLTGQRPRFFRPLGGFRSPWLDPVLQRMDLRLACWTRRGLDSVRGDPQAVYHRLANGLAPGDILLLHDGDAARTPSGTPVSLEVLPRLLATMSEAALQPVTLADALPPH